MRCDDELSSDDAAFDDESPECATCRQEAEESGFAPDCAECAMLADELGPNVARYKE